MPPREIDPNVVLVCAGDSLTAGLNPGDDSETYVARLRERLGCQVINAGVAGDLTSDLLARVDREVLRHDPNVVLVFIGGNDYLGGTTRAKFAKDLEALVKQLAESDATLIVVEVPSGLVWNSFAGLYRKAARQHGAILVPESRLRWLYVIDLLFRKYRKVPLTKDKIHLSPAGARYVADWLEPYVRRALAVGR